MIPLVCTSVTCPERETCPWRQKSFAEVKTGNAFGRARDCFQPGEVCPRALHRALHSMVGAAGRWEGRKASGLSDADLADSIGYEFGEWHQGYNGPGYTAVRKPPSIWFGNRAGADGKYRKPDLQGRGLLAAVRELLGVPLPAQAAPAAQPWAGLPMFAGGAHA